MPFCWWTGTLHDLWWNAPGCQHRISGGYVGDITHSCMHRLQAGTHSFSHCLQHFHTHSAAVTHPLPRSRTSGLSHSHLHSRTLPALTRVPHWLVGVLQQHTTMLLAPSQHCPTSHIHGFWTLNRLHQLDIGLGNFTLVLTQFLTQMLRQMVTHILTQILTRVFGADTDADTDAFCIGADTDAVAGICHP